MITKMPGALQVCTEEGCGKHFQQMQVSEYFKLINISRAHKQPNPCHLSK